MIRTEILNKRQQTKFSDKFKELTKGKIDNF